MNIRKFSLIVIASGLAGSIAFAQSPTPANTQPVVKTAAAPEQTQKSTVTNTTDQKPMVTAKSDAAAKPVVAKTAATSHKHQVASKKKTTKTATVAQTSTKTSSTGEKKDAAKVSEPISKTAAVTKTN